MKADVRGLTRRAALAVAVALGPAGAFAQASGQQPGGTPAPLPIDAVALVRCVAGRPLPCVRVHLRVPGAAAVAAREGAREGTDDAGAWRARLGPYTLEPVSARVVRAGGPPRAVLTLVDVSGSMGTNGGMQVARAAVRSFVRDLGAGLPPADSAAVRAGVAAFASRGVVAGIRGAALVAPDAAAGAVDRLPAPAGNTGLYAAVIAGAERVAATARQLGPDAQAALVVVTDGRNDVLDPAGRPRPGDDPDLATGPAGRTAAAEAARRLGVPLFLVGVGAEPDMGELRALAGDGGLAFRTAVDAVALREALARVDQALTPGREVVFAATGVERPSLARPGWAVDVVRRGTGALGGAATPAAVHWTGRWPAPVLTAPTFAGAVFGDSGVRPTALGGPAPSAPAAPATAPAWLRTAADEAPVVGRRGAVALFLAALAGAAWWLPRALWRAAPLGATSPRAPSQPIYTRAGTAPAPTPGVAYGAVGTAGAVGDAGVLRTVPLRGARAAAAAAPAPPAAASPGGVRPDVREAPPRRPADVTAAGARRRLAPTVAGGQTFAVHRPDAPSSAPGSLPAGPRARPDFDSR